MKLNASGLVRPIAVILAATTALSAPIAAQQARPPVDPRFAEQVRQVLLQHPEYLFEAAALGQQRQRDAQLKEQNAKVDKLRPTLFARAPFGPVIGNPQAQTTVAEFLDYRCGYCKRAAPLVDKVAAEDRNVRFVVVMRPVLGPESETLARFALASARQGKFSATHDALYALPQGGVTDDVLRGVAQKVGLDFEQAKRDMTSDAVVQELARHNGLADQMGVTGTPFFVTAKSVIPGAPQTEDQLKAAIAQK